MNFTLTSEVEDAVEGLATPDKGRVSLLVSPGMHRPFQVLVAEMQGTFPFQFPFILSLGLLTSHVQRIKKRNIYIGHIPSLY